MSNNEISAHFGTDVVIRIAGPGDANTLAKLRYEFRSSFGANCEDEGAGPATELLTSECLGISRLTSGCDVRRACLRYDIRPMRFTSSWNLGSDRRSLKLGSTSRKLRGEEISPSRDRLDVALFLISQRQPHISQTLHER